MSDLTKMGRLRFIGAVVVCVGVGLALSWAAPMRRVNAAEVLVVHAKRESKTDLEVSWGGVREFVSYNDLLGLPQVTATVAGDENFTLMHTPRVQVTGVRLAELEKRLGVPADLDLMMARCSDGYAGPFPAEYIREHHPILVLRVDGMTLAAWARKTGNEDPGPYLIAYDNFVPAWQVLKHEDRAQVPMQMVELEFKRAKDVFGPITPRALFGPDSPEMKGFGIAKQNCLRCHAAGPFGGTKGGLGWEGLARLAKSDSAVFEQYVQAPKSVSPGAKMPANPQYDAETLHAVSAYFRSF